MTIIAIEEAFEQFRAGSQGFCAHIETHAGLQISRTEIERICDVAPNASKFLQIWQDEDWWNDDNN